MGKGKRYTEDQILSVLKEIEAGASIASVARKHGITDQTLYRWRERYAGMTISELQELRVLQEENRKLKSIVASQALDIEAHKCLVPQHSALQLFVIRNCYSNIEPKDWLLEYWIVTTALSH